MSFPTVNGPIKSPSLNEFDLPTITDQHGFVVPLIGVVQPDSSGNTTLPTGSGLVVAKASSQVTARRQPPQVGPSKIPTVGLVGVDPSTGVPIPFVAAVATVASQVSGKFQSTVRTATGLAESIAHGLGIIPSLVLVSIYDDTNAGVIASGFVITEGTHTSTNIVVTVTANAKYKVIAFV